MKKTKYLVKLSDKNYFMLYRADKKPIYGKTAYKLRENGWEFANHNQEAFLPVLDWRRSLVSVALNLRMIINLDVDIEE
jgi:hypothetical protein